MRRATSREPALNGLLETASFHDILVRFERAQIALMVELLSRAALVS
jgi:hypothetical protein